MTWVHKFVQFPSELCEFLATLSDQQARSSKVMPGRMAKHAIYGWDVFYPNDVTSQSLGEGAETGA